MIDPKRIRDELDTVRQALQNRHFPAEALDQVAQLDAQWLEARHKLEQLQTERNQQTPKGKPTDEQRQALGQLSAAVKAQQETVDALATDLQKACLMLPSIPDATVPIGASEDDNVEVKTWGTPPTLDFEPKSHDVLAEKLGILDFESSAKTSGARFVCYRGLGAKLERALINFMLDVQTQDNGYEEMIPPVLINSQSMVGTGQLPKFAEESFKIENTDFWLAPTAEVPLTNLYRDHIFDEAELPKAITAYTPCFRKEAGSYGKDMKGIIRLHQFNKVELVRFCSPEHSAAEHEKLLGHAETILQKLGLAYRVITLCTGDLGFSAGKTYDIEVWLPSQNKYREISSCSNFFDFQARRAMIRYRESGTGKVRYLHTLNGSGLAVGRTFAALLENGQQADGSILIPEVLVPYLGVKQLHG
ncbi:MAG: serine--tRNA ligase [Candidatus Margulisiibacteriota bacterium]